jgi:hypothetical protein
MAFVNESGVSRCDPFFGVSPAARIWNFEGGCFIVDSYTSFLQRCFCHIRWQPFRLETYDRRRQLGAPATGEQSNKQRIVRQKASGEVPPARLRRIRSDFDLEVKASAQVTTYVADPVLRARRPARTSPIPLSHNSLVKPNRLASPIY